METTGIKRVIASALLPVIAALQASPDPLSQLLATLLNAVAASIASAGLTQATVRGSLLKYKLPTLGALFAIGLLLVPPESPYYHLLQQASLIVAGAAVGSKVGQAQEAKDQNEKLEKIFSDVR